MGKTEEKIKERMCALVKESIAYSNKAGAKSGEAAKECFFSARYSENTDKEEQ